MLAAAGVRAARAAAVDAVFASGVDAGRDQKESEMSGATLPLLTRTRWGPVKSLLVPLNSTLLLMLVVLSTGSSPWYLRMTVAAGATVARWAEEGAPPFPSARSARPGPRPLLANPTRFVVEAELVAPARVSVVGVFGIRVCCCCCCCCFVAMIFLDVAVVDDAPQGLFLLGPAFSFPAAGEIILLVRSILSS